MSEDLRDVGEFGLIERLRALFPPGPGVVVGIGDDAAVLDKGVLFAADMLVEGVHFDVALSSPTEVGYKALITNVSDIAAMGGRPRHATISMGAPDATALHVLLEIATGLAAAAGECGVSIVGGDTVQAPSLIISVAMLGEATRPVLRSGAKVGDALCVTGEVGAAAAGLALLRRAQARDEEAARLLDRFPELAAAHRRGRARVREGLAVTGIAHAMIDVSDGVAADSGHVAKMSRCGVRVDEASLPLAHGVKEVAELIGRSPSDFAMNGGDDYELLIATNDPDAVRAAIAPTALSVIGSFTSDPKELPTGGWDHFA